LNSLDIKSGSIIIDHPSDNVIFKIQDSNDEYSVFHTIDDGQGDYNILYGIDNNGNVAVDDYGSSKIYFGGYNKNGFLSLSTGMTGSINNAVVFNTTLLLNSADQTLRIGDPNDHDGLRGGEGNIIADTSGNLFANDLSVESNTTIGGTLIVTGSSAFNTIISGSITNGFGDINIGTNDFTGGSGTFTDGLIETKKSSTTDVHHWRLSNHSGTNYAVIGIEGGSDDIYIGTDTNNKTLTLDRSDSGSATFNTKLTITDLSINNGLVYTDGNGLLKNSTNATLDSSGNVNLSGTLIVTGSSDLKSTLGVTGSVSMGSTLTVTDDATFNSNILVNDKITLNNSEYTTTSASVDSGSNTVISTTPQATYSSVFYDYKIIKGSDMRAGTVVALSDGTSIEFTEYGATDIGDTVDVTLHCDYNGGNIRLLADSVSDG